MLYAEQNELRDTEGLTRFACQNGFSKHPKASKKWTLLNALVGSKRRFTQFPRSPYTSGTRFAGYKGRRAVVKMDSPCLQA